MLLENMIHILIDFVLKLRYNGTNVASIFLAGPPKTIICPFLQTCRPDYFRFMIRTAVNQSHRGESIRSNFFG